MSVNKSLEATYSVKLNGIYKREDNTISNSTVNGGINYSAIAGTLSNGVNADGVANLLFYKKYTIGVAGVETFDWDGNSLVDIWGDTLDFSKVKKLIVHNVEEVAQTLKVITLAWAGESAVIKGGGSRIFCEPAAAGIAAVTTSMTLTAGSEATSVVVIAIGNDDTVSL